MTLEQLHKAIRTGRHGDAEYIWYENGEYSTSTQVLEPLPERVFVDTVGGYRQRHGLGGQTMTHDEAIIVAARWYRQRYEVKGDIEVRSFQVDGTSHYYCELYSSEVADPVGITVYTDGRIDMLGEGMELIKISVVPVQTK